LAALTGTQALNRENLGDAVVDQMRNLALDVERFLYREYAVTSQTLLLVAQQLEIWAVEEMLKRAEARLDAKET